MADLALDLVERERRRQIESERTAIRGELLKQMSLAPPAAAVPETQPVPPVERAPTASTPSRPASCSSSSACAAGALSAGRGRRA
jgi:hypothetical protein